MENSKIGWTDHTFNPWVGCEKVSPGCAHCYAETLNHRWGKDNWGPNAERTVTSDSNWKKPLAWNKAAEKEGRRAKVFCASMADVFEDRWTLDEPRARLWTLIEETPWLDWLLLTKRPENMSRLALHPGIPANAWIGTSVENQAMADKRIDALRKVDARIRFLSCEPLIGPVDLYGKLGGIDWVIVGGESGPGARPMQTAWAEAILGATKEVNAAFFMKQMGGSYDKRERLTDLPEHLRIRDWPTAKHTKGD